MDNENVALRRFDDLELGQEQRHHRRHLVHIPVRFSGRDQVEIAENISRGGLFVRGDFDLELDSSVELTVELPGFRGFEVTARVAHCRTSSQAGRWGGSAGVGLEITSAEPAFQFALHSYLHKLGMRCEALVLCADFQDRRFFESAGYRTALLPAPGEVSKLAAPVVAIIAPLDMHEVYADDLGPEMVTIGPDRSRGEALTELDSRLESRRLQSWR